MKDIKVRDENYKFSDLVDIEAFKEILESFYKVTKIPNGIVGNSGEVITQAGWVDACTIFHRANVESKLCCEESNLSLMENLSNQKVTYSKCKNGLLDYATPIIIDGKRIATIFLGQILDKKPDMTFFKNQAKKYNYDEKSYLKAITEVPIVKKEEMESLMSCILKMAEMLAESGLSKLREDNLKQDLEKNKEQKIQLKDILDFSPVGISWSNLDGKIEYINHQFTKLFGYTLEDIPTISDWYSKAYPDESYRKGVIEKWQRDVLIASKTGLSSPELEASITCKDNSIRRVFIRVSYLNGLRLVSFNDITAHWKSELRNLAHDKMLEMVARNLPLNEILENIIYTIEIEDTNSVCSILLLDNEGKHIINSIAPSLPKFYNDAIEGVEIGIGVGSCGTAAFTKKRVIVEDIMTHEYWQQYKELAKKAGVQACWSEPIISSNGKVLGTFAIYHTKPSIPKANDIEKISFAANLASIAIENRNIHNELEKRAYNDYLTKLPNRRYFIEQAELELSRFSRYGGKLCLMMFDIDHFKNLNDKYGHKVGDLVLQKIAEISREVLRDIDVIGRIGGEEFAVLLPHTDIKEAFNIAERLRIEISKGEILFNNEIINNFTASFGITEPKKASKLDELLIQVDTALYEAKDSGRNKVCVFKENEAKIPKI